MLIFHSPLLSLAKYNVRKGPRTRTRSNRMNNHGGAERSHREYLSLSVVSLEARRAEPRLGQHHLRLASLASFYRTLEVAAWSRRKSSITGLLQSGFIPAFVAEIRHDAQAHHSRTSLSSSLFMQSLRSLVSFGGCQVPIMTAAFHRIRRSSAVRSSFIAVNASAWPSSESRHADSTGTFQPQRRSFSNAICVSAALG